MNTKCALIDRCIAKGEPNGRYIGQKGLTTLVNMSNEQNDGIFEKEGKYYLHDCCYKAYTRRITSKSIFNGNSTNKTKEHNITTRSASSSYECDSNCLICGSNLDKYKAHKNPKYSKYKNSSICLIDKKSRVLYSEKF